MKLSHATPLAAEVMGDSVAQVVSAAGETTNSVGVAPDTIFVAVSATSAMDVILLVVQVLTLLALVLYVWKTSVIARGTLHLADETRESRKALLAPRVIVYFDPAEIYFAHIVIENVGPGTATNVRLRFDPSLKTTQDRGTTDFFETPKFLPPGQRLSSLFDTWEAYLKSDLPQSYHVTVTYDGLEDGLTHSSEHVLETIAIKDRRQLTRYGMHELVQRVESLSKKLDQQLKGITDGLAALESSRFFAFSDADSVGAACGEIDAVWSLVRASKDAHQVYFSSDGVAAAVRRAALAGVLALNMDTDDDELRAALIDVALVASRIRHLGDSWDEDLTAAIANLESIRSAGDARAGSAC